MAEEKEKPRVQPRPHPDKEEKKTDFQSLPLAARVVFHRYGAYLNESWLFGKVVEIKKNKKQCRLVEAESRPWPTNDAITGYHDKTPMWDIHMIGGLCPVTVGRGKANAGAQWITLDETKYQFYGLYDETKKYTDCSDSP
jgi:hypothetical protein